MAESLTILKNDPNITEYINFNALREQGIEYIAKFSGKIWTDHNLHDPGITILEALCYAITDLGYRLDLPIEELLALDQEDTPEEDNFYTPEEILTVNPLTILDYRKLLIDIDGVRNAWLRPSGRQEVPIYINCEDEIVPTVKGGHLQYEPIPERELCLNGLYKVFIEPDPLRIRSGADCEENLGKPSLGDVLEEVNARLNQHRNLGEDFFDICVLDNEEISICTDIELEADGNPEDALVEIITALQEFLSPTIKYFSIQELIEEGKSLKDIFAGRPITQPDVSSKGFVDTEQLLSIKQHVELHVSDFHREIFRAPGVRAVRFLKLLNFIDGQVMSNGDEWCLKLTPGYSPIFSLSRSRIRFFQGTIFLPVDIEEVKRRVAERISNVTKVTRPNADLDLPIPLGEYRSDLSDYRSVQHDFPLTYRIGEGEMPASASSQRKSEALQLKGYLTFYDQLLANFLAQLGNVRRLFALRPNGHQGQDDQSELENRSYFSQPLNSVPDIQRLIFFHDREADATVSRGEVIACLPEELFFSSRIERDQFIERITRLFESKNATYNIERTGTRYSFHVVDPDGNILLVSSQDFASEGEARQRAELFDFLGVLPETYRGLNDFDQEVFTLEAIYAPINYLKFLNQITEDQDTYFRRKNRFLDHLLARFAEDFTDYVLLMFALNGRQLDPEIVIKDKSQFLACYPDISRNRGRAYDYTQGNDLWDSENISGFEKRVAKLMGIQDHRRKTLGNFKVTLRNKGCMEVRNNCGELIFVTEIPYTAPSEDDKNYFIELITDSQDHSSYQPYDCITDGIYGIHLVDDQGKIFATHPITYPTSEDRNTRLGQIRSHFRYGFYVEKKVCKDSWCFQLLDEHGDVLFVSTNPFSAEHDALLAYDEFFWALWDLSNYHIIPKTGGFTVQITVEIDGSEVVVARMPDSECFANVDEAQDWIEMIHDMICAKVLHHRFEEEKVNAYAWQWDLELDGLQLFSSERRQERAYHHFYDTEEDAASGFIKFLRAGLTANNYTKVSNSGGTFFQIVNRRGRIIARSSLLASEADCQQAIDAVREQIALLLNQLDPLPPSDLSDHLISEVNGLGFPYLANGHRIVLEDAYGTPWLVSSQRFSSMENAIIRFHQLVQLASQFESYLIRNNPEDGQFGFLLFDEEELVMFHPYSYPSSTERDDALECLIEMIKDNLCPFKVSNLECFELTIEVCNCSAESENCDCCLEVVLSGTEQFCLAEEMEDRIQEILDLVKSGGVSYNYVPNSANPIGYQLSLVESATGDIIAQTNDFYVLDAPIGSNPFIWAINQHTQIEVDCLLNKSNTTDYDCEEGHFETGFRLRKLDFCLAYHPNVYESPEDRDEAVEEIVNRAVCGAAPYQSTEDQIDPDSLVCDWNPYRPHNYTCRTFRNTDKEIYFEILCDTVPLWESPCGYLNSEEALQACHEAWFHIFKFAKVCSNYDLVEECIVLRNNFGEIIAQLPDTLIDPDIPFDPCSHPLVIKSCCQAKIYPIVKENGKFKFRIYDPQVDRTDWISTASYETQKEAIAAYHLLLELAQYQPNITPNDDDLSCRYGFDLGEVLLESARGFTEECLYLEEGEQKSDLVKKLKAWQFENGGVNAFLRLAQDETAFYPYVDTKQFCQHSFRVVDDQYRVAYHPQYYATVKEREAALERLYQKMLCNGLECTKVTLDRTKVKICVLNGSYHYLVEDEATGIVLWRSYQSFPDFDSAREAYLMQVVELIDAARQPDCYQLTFSPDQGYNANLQRIDGSTVAVLPNYLPDIDQLVSAVHERVQFARLYPITRFCGILGFRLYCETDAEECYELEHPNPPADAPACNPVIKLTIHGEVTWRSIRPFNSQSEVSNFLHDHIIEGWGTLSDSGPTEGGGTSFRDCGCIDTSGDEGSSQEDENENEDEPIIGSCNKFKGGLLGNITNYQRNSRGDCGPFSIEITNQEHVLAEHPRSYSCISELEAAIERTKGCISSEGFHLLEHILLRPRKGQPTELYYSLCFNTPDNQLINLSGLPEFSSADILRQIKVLLDLLLGPDIWYRLLDFEADEAPGKQELIKALANILKQCVSGLVPGALQNWVGSFSSLSHIEPQYANVYNKFNDGFWPLLEERMQSIISPAEWNTISPILRRELIALLNCGVFGETEISDAIKAVITEAEIELTTEEETGLFDSSFSDLLLEIEAGFATIVEHTDILVLNLLPHPHVSVKQIITEIKRCVLVSANSNGSSFDESELRQKLLHELVERYPEADHSLLELWVHFWPLEEVVNLPESIGPYWDEIRLSLQAVVTELLNEKVILPEDGDVLLSAMLEAVREALIEGETSNINEDLRELILQFLLVRLSVLQNDMLQVIQLALGAGEEIDSINESLSELISESLQATLAELQSAMLETVQEALEAGETVDSINESLSELIPQSLQGTLAEISIDIPSTALEAISEAFIPCEELGQMIELQPKIAMCKFIYEFKKCLLLVAEDTDIYHELSQKLIECYPDIDGELISNRIATLELESITSESNIPTCWIDICDQLEMQFVDVLFDPEAELTSEQENQKDALTACAKECICEATLRGDTGMQVIRECLHQCACKEEYGLDKVLIEQTLANMDLSEKLIAISDKFAELEAFFDQIRQELEKNLNLCICLRNVAQNNHKLLPISADCAAETKVLKENSSDCPCCGEDNSKECLCYIPGADPYSFWLTLVLPYWPNRFQNTDFRAFFQETLRREAPAHIALRICWIDPCQMMDFENKYCDWLVALSGNQACDFDQAHCDIVDSISNFDNIYPPSELISCGSLTTSSAMIVNRSTLS